MTQPPLFEEGRMNADDRAVQEELANLFNAALPALKKDKEHLDKVAEENARRREMLERNR